LLLFAVVLAWPAVAAAPLHADDAARAAASFAAMERAFYDSRSGEYREQPGAQPGSHAWPFSQALAAQIAVASVPRIARRASVRARLAHLEQRFRSGALYTAWPGGDVYLDDNEWLAEDLLAWSDLTGDRTAQQRAATIFNGVTDAWDDAPSHPCPGGVFWTNASSNHDRNTVSTANGAVVGLRLYAATKNPSYLTWSKTMLGWLDRCMRAPNGLYWDHVDLDGNVDTTEWSYNQGSVIEANVLLYEATGDAGALAEAERVADASITYFDSRWRGGEPAEFAAVFFRSLLALAVADGNVDYADAAETYASDAWKVARDPRTGLFRYSGKATLLQQAAFVQLYSALAAFPTGVR
jgi:uncharacterized protein YyaL (SSP411 family)